MEFKEVAEGRTSIRKFLTDAVPKQDILEMLRVATRAASASNMQMWRFYVVTNRGKLDEMRNAVQAEHQRLHALAGAQPSSDFFATLFAGAPVTIAVAYAAYESGTEKVMRAAGLNADEILSRRQRPDIQSVGAAIQMLLLAAYEKGYGTCWMTAPMMAREALESIIGVKSGETLCALVALGRPGVAPRKSDRLPVEQVTTFVD